jgi:hypothetical protein
LVSRQCRLIDPRKSSERNAMINDETKLHEEELIEHKDELSEDVDEEVQILAVKTGLRAGPNAC